MPPEMPVLVLDSVFDTGARRGLAVPPRSTVADMVAAAFPGAPLALRRDIVVATIDGQVVPVEAWPSVRPKLGTTVILKPVPQGDVLRNVLTIAVTVAAIAAGQLYAPGLLAAAGVAQTATSLAVASAVITSSTLLAGTLLINALVPARKDQKDQPSYNISGLQNQLTPDGAIPFVLGKVRYAPPYAARPFTQAVGDDRFVVASFCNGYGPLVARDWRIGTTPLARFADISFEERQGYASDGRLTLYPSQVLEEALSIELLTTAQPRGGPQIRTTASDVTYAEIDTTYPGGVFAVNKDGETGFFQVDIATRYRLAGNDATPWTAGPTIAVASKKRKAITRTTRIDFPARGRYEVELNRLTPDWDEVDQSDKKTQRSGRSAWSVLRSFRPEYPIAFDKPLALAAIRIRATGQLNGVVDALNAEFSSLCPDWDAATGTWITRETNNPASLFRYVLTGPAITYPLAADEIAALGDWHAFCVAKGLSYNRIHDYEASVLDVLSDIAAAGRASPQNGGETWGVVIDRALSTITAHIGPRNSWGFSGERPYVRYPDAFRVPFLDETNNFEKAERVVPWPGFVGTPVVVEKLDLPGVTNPSMVWKETRRRQYELIHRPDTYTVHQDWESMVVQRGDLARLGHDVLDRIMVSGRVVAVAGAQVVLDEAVTMEAGKSYACRFRRADGASLVRSVATVPGTSRAIRITGAGSMPSVGNPDVEPPIPPDLAFFGVANRETLACTVKGVEAMENLTARLTLVDHAPQIEALIDAEVPPPWSGRAGAEAQPVTTAPLAPTIGDVISGQAAADYATGANPYPILVAILGNAGSYVSAATYEVQHRLAATTAWSGPVSAPAGAGIVNVPGYSLGQQVELQARAVSASGMPSSWSASTTHTVGAADPAAPVNLLLSVERRTVSGSTMAVALRLTSNAVAGDGLKLIGRYRLVGSTAWLDMAPDSDNRFSLTTGIVSDGANYEAQGAIATLAASRQSLWTASSPAAVTAVADATAPAAPTYTSATASGTTVSHVVRQSPSANARSLQLRRALGFDKVFADAATSASQAMSPNQGDPPLADTIDLGFYQWWAVALNGSGLASPPAGPKSVLRMTQPGNILTAPTDLTNAAWVKTRTTATLSGSAPDGSSATMIAETAVNSSHMVQQTVAITNGARYRASMAIKAAGRTRGAFHLYDSAVASRATITFDIGAGTFSVSSAGTVVTGAVATLSKLSADWWLLTVTGTVASDNAVVRLALYDDAGSVSYLGDTAKGFLVGGANLAPAS